MAKFSDLNRFKKLACVYAISILIILAHFIAQSNAIAGQVDLKWDTTNDSDVIGYMVYWRPYKTNDRKYSESVDVGFKNKYTVSGLTEGDKYYFCVTAYNRHTESHFSNEVSATIPISNILASSIVEYTKEMNGDEVDYPKIEIEAESVYLNSPMTTAYDKDASGGQYICVPGGRRKGGYAEYTFNIPKSGDYVLWARTLAVTGANNSFYVSLENGDDWTWHIRTSSDWIWDVQRSYFFKAGQHKLIIKQREKRTKLDKIIFSSDPGYVPVN